MPRSLRHPARLVPLAFLVAVVFGAGLLMLPWSRTGTGFAPLITALFTAASAACGTGLATVDTSTYWSPFGQAVILALIQAGGFGIMTLATLMGLLVSRRLGLRSRLVAQAETRVLALGDVRTVLLRVAVVMLSIELVTALALTVRFRIAYHEQTAHALWHGVFHAVSAVSSAGFALYPDSLIRFATDPWICLPIMVAALIGGIGFPVIFELAREWRQPAGWSVHTKITLLGTAVLLTTGTCLFLLTEWSNPRTAGPMTVPGKLLVASFHSAMPTTAGFNAVDYAAVHPETLAVTDILMFIGGGSAGTAGGIKVTTFFLLAFVIWAEVRGETDVVAFRRRISSAVQRQALTVALLGVAVVVTGTLVLLALTELPLDAVAFETASAFGTTGLSTGITASLPAAGQLVLITLMFTGRVGTITLGTALALRSRDRLYRYPEERPIVG